MSDDFLAKDRYDDHPVSQKRSGDSKTKSRQEKEGGGSGLRMSSRENADGELVSIALDTHQSWSQRQTEPISRIALEIGLDGGCVCVSVCVCVCVLWE